MIYVLHLLIVAGVIVGGALVVGAVAFGVGLLIKTGILPIVCLVIAALSGLTAAAMWGARPSWVSGAGILATVVGVFSTIVYANLDE